MLKGEVAFSLPSSPLELSLWNRKLEVLQAVAPDLTEFCSCSDFATLTTSTS